MRFTPLFLALGLMSLACREGTGAGGAGGTTAAGSEACKATFRWLQKDAYKDTAGRTSDLWPPHTTTALDISCNGTSVSKTFMSNHGTEPDEVDKNGDVFLIEVKNAEATGTRDELMQLVGTYQACQCDPGTKFLSLDSISDALAKQLLDDVAKYIKLHLVCSVPGGTDALLLNLQNGKITQVITDLPKCTWGNGTGFEDGLNAAFQALVMQTQETLQNYHVCNNDALLQAGLFEEFATSHQVGTCDDSAAICHGPMWFYKP